MCVSPKFDSDQQKIQQNFQVSLYLISIHY